MRACVRVQVIYAGQSCVRVHNEWRAPVTDRAAKPSLRRTINALMVSAGAVVPGTRRSFIAGRRRLRRRDLRVHSAAVALLVTTPAFRFIAGHPSSCRRFSSRRRPQSARRAPAVDLGATGAL